MLNKTGSQEGLAVNRYIRISEHQWSWHEVARFGVGALLVTQTDLKPLLFHLSYSAVMVQSDFGSHWKFLPIL